MRFRKLIKLVFILGAFAAGIGIGFKLGVNSRTRSELSVSIPALVQIHKSIETHDSREAMGMTEMLLLSKLNRYGLLRDDLCARALYGKDIVNSELFKRHLEEAMAIKQASSTNLIFFDNSRTNR